MPPFIAAIDDGALWLTAVVGGLIALGWLFKRAWQGYRKLTEFMRKADVVLDIAAYEMQHNGGGSIKDAASQLPAIAVDVAALKDGAEVLRLGAVGIAQGAAELRAALADHVEQAAAIHEEQAAQLAELVKDHEAVDNLAAAVGPAIRATPHNCDLQHITDEADSDLEHEPEEGKP